MQTLIVGGGLIGLATAQVLMERGEKMQTGLWSPQACTARRCYALPVKPAKGILGDN